jgi:hypothetical protein
MMSPRTRSDERGSVLVMTLVLIVVVAIAATAVLSSQFTTTRVRGVTAEIKAIDVSADGMMQEAIAKLRNDPDGLFGRYNNTSGLCDQIAPASVDVIAGAAGAARVECEPVDTNSGRSSGTAEPYPSTLISIGGQSGPGSYSNPLGRDTASPYCDDFSGAGACEAGILIGRGTNASGNFGMLIASNGADTTSPLVKSNSSIVINQSNYGGGTNRFLQVEGVGGIWARRGCTPFGDQIIAPRDQFQLNYVRAAFDSASGGTTLSSYYGSATPRPPDVYTAADPYFNCWNSKPCALFGGVCYTRPWVTGEPAFAWANELPMQDPLDEFRHELWDARTATIHDGKSCEPRRDGALPWHHTCGDFTRFGPGQLTPQSTNASWTTSNASPGTPRALPPLTDCAKGYVQFQPGYYNDAPGLNQFLTDSSCHETVLHFMPGTYYFDFNGSKVTGWEWGGVGKPTQAPRIRQQRWIVGGGAPTAASRPMYQRWTPCPLTNPFDLYSGRNCIGVAQPEKRMDPQLLDASPNDAWLENPPDLGSMSKIDDRANLALVTSDRTSPVAIFGRFGTPIPEQFTGSCDNNPHCYHARKISVKLKLAYKLPVVAGGWSRREVTFGNVGAECTTILPTGNFQAGSELEFDLTNGCPTTARSGATTYSVTGTRWGTTGTFPENDCTPSPCVTSWTPPQVNVLDARLKFQLNNNSAVAIGIEVNGAALATSWQGPPSPSFPGACDPQRGGTQFIFGGRTQMRFDNDALLSPNDNEGVWLDLCADATWTKSAYGPAVIGLTDHAGFALDKDGRKLNGGYTDDGVFDVAAANPARHISTDAIVPAREAVCCGSVAQPWRTDPDPTVDNTPYNPGLPTERLVDMQPPITSTNKTSFLWNWDPTNPNRPGWATSGVHVNAMINGTALKQEALHEILEDDDLAYMETGPNWTSGTVQVTFNLPKNVIPAGSFVDRVEIRFKHAEQDVANLKVRLSPATNNGNFGSAWVSEAGPTGARQGASWPRDTAMQLSPGTNTIDGIPTTNNADVWTTWKYGRFLAPLADADADVDTLNTKFDPTGTPYTTVDGSGNPVETSDVDPTGNNWDDANAYTRRSLNPNWANERLLGDDSRMGTVEALFGGPSSPAGAQVQISAIPKTGTTGAKLKIDMLTIRVEYRPPGTLRPLRGCLTTRSGRAWQTAQTNFVQPPQNTNNASPRDSYIAIGTDRDWSARTDGGDDGVVSDEGYTSDKVGQSDGAACGLIVMNGPRFHVDGSLYAPNAAVDLVGNDNDAPYASNTVIARQFTATRWKNSFDTPTLGGIDIGGRLDRRVKLIYKDDNGKIQAVAIVRIDDGDGSTWGRSVFVESWNKQPEG